MRGCYFVALAGVLFTTTTLAAELSEKWTSKAELQGPESAIYDAKRDLLYVSNVNGGPMDDDQNGYISQLDMAGNIVDQHKFRSGLSAPKGLTIVNDHLYVADIDRVVVFDLAAGVKTAEHVVEGTQFLNDLDHDADGNVYVSDMLATTVHRISNGQVEEWINDERLPSPNGLAAHGDLLLVGTWGKMDQEGFATSVPGHIVAVSLKDKTIFDWGTSESIGNMDAVEMTAEGNALVSDWMAGGIKLVKPDGEVEDLIDLPQGSADFDYVQETQMIYLPMMKDGFVRAYKFTP